MPNMKVCGSTGALIFSPTKEEKEIIDLKKELREGIDEVKKMQEELKNMYKG